MTRLTGAWSLAEVARLSDAELVGGSARGVLLLDVIGLRDVNDSLGARRR